MHCSLNQYTNDKKLFLKMPFPVFFFPQVIPLLVTQSRICLLPSAEADIKQQLHHIISYNSGYSWKKMFLS